MELLVQQPITKDTTLNALVKRFPQLLRVLHIVGLDQPWHGTETLEEVAWYRGLEVQDLLGELNRSTEAVH